MGDTRNLSPYLSQVFFLNEILYENTIPVSIKLTGKPFGIRTAFDSGIAPGLPLHTVTHHYWDIVNVA